MEPKQWPATIDEAVDVVIATRSDEDKGGARSRSLSGSDAQRFQCYPLRLTGAL